MAITVTIKHRVARRGRRRDMVEQTNDVFSPLFQSPISIIEIEQPVWYRNHTSEISSPPSPACWRSADSQGGNFERKDPYRRADFKMGSNLMALAVHVNAREHFDSAPTSELVAGIFLTSCRGYRRSFEAVAGCQLSGIIIVGHSRALRVSRGIHFDGGQSVAVGPSARPLGFALLARASAQWRADAPILLRDGAFP